ncbi:MAG TPA: diguanylate cyclase [Candidatus Hydrogenedens sp.]|nr:diguanylate cyclase [Candidatus Hydrogenedens sp.]HOL19304.1 diguanylate cyclase [Candidatus Hydrogenedens sp.]HPP59257.1 diguanylate cyclase [Candidatus Hydrogenedens sp.]
MSENHAEINILVAEDDTVSRLILTSVLKKWGYNPIDVTNGKEALELLTKDPPLLAILDWVMPELDGIDVVKMFRKANKEASTYIIILTTKTDKEDVIAGLEAGADDYICKPFDNDELWARIRVGLRTATLQKKLIETQKALEYEAVHDPLTSVLNRRGVFERLQEELERAERNNLQTCIAMCDLDYFKKINDTYGHQTGDDVLKGFVKLIRSQLRPYDLLGRIGGEEFLIVIPNINKQDAINTLKRLNTTIQENEIDTITGKHKITVSIGGILIQGKDTIDSIIKYTDEMLYLAKEKGRNQVCFKELTNYE